MCSKILKIILAATVPFFGVYLLLHALSIPSLSGSILFLTGILMLPGGFVLLGFAIASKPDESSESEEDEQEGY